MSIHYMEIVTNDLDALCASYENVYGLSFGAPEPDMGHARLATQSDGSVLGIRKPLAGHEQPTLRTYIEVADIENAANAAEAAGAMIAYPPTRQGDHGMFAIYIQGDVQHGLWQR
ncbi:MAG: VOC family protein [Myxococcota bacterium]